MAPTHVFKARARSSRVSLLAAAATVLLIPGSAAAHHDGDHARPAASTPTIAVETSGHAHHAPAASPATPPADSGAAPAGWEFNTPDRPRVAKGPRGPLWVETKPKVVGTGFMGVTFAQRFVAARLAEARGTDIESLLAARAALTTAQATKKLSKKCQKLVKITKSKQIAKLKKADKKARTKCLEQRRKIIADSKKKPTGGTTPPSNGGTTTPSTGGTTSPSTGGGDTGNNGGGGGGTTTPTPTTPDNPTPTTPTNTCTPFSSTILVDAISETEVFGVNFNAKTCGLKAGKRKFLFSSSDENEPHSLVIAKKVGSNGDISSGADIVASISGEINPDDNDSVPAVEVTLAAGTYYLVCTVPGHGSMTLEFKVIA